MEEISTTFRVNRLHQIKSVRKVLEKDNDDTSILSRDIVIGANAYLYTNRNILLTTYIKKDATGKAIATIDTDFGLGSIYAGVDVFGTGNYSLNIGNNNEVNTNYSAAIGTGLVPRTENGIVIGKYNDKNVTNNYVVIGGGTASQGKDLVTIDTAGVTKINNSDNAENTNTGALRIMGGILSQGTNYFTNITRITNNENANIANTGALRVTGGIYSGGENWFANRTVINNSTGADINGQGALKVVGGIYTGQDNYFDSNTTITGITKITNNTENALQIAGGIRVDQRATVNDLTITNAATFTGTDKLLFGDTSLASLLSKTAPAATTVQVTTPNGDQGTIDTPVYIDKKVVKSCNKYAGGTKVTLNGSDKGATTASFYAPTTNGTTGYILQSQQDGEPIWVSPMTISVNSAKSAETLAVLDTGSSTQPVYFSQGVPKASNANVGGNTTPIYFKNGVITSCSNYAGGTQVVLNGINRRTLQASFYAPTSSGSNNQVLISQGENTSPTWITADDNTNGLTVHAADKLTTKHILRVNLENVNLTQYFDGTGDAQNIAITGILPEAHGGTGKERVQDSVMEDIGIKMGIHSQTFPDDKSNNFLWIDVPCSVQEAVVKFYYKSATSLPDTLYLWGCKCNAIGWNEKIAGTEICIGEMTHIGHIYTFSTINSELASKNILINYLNTENTSFTVSNSRTSSVSVGDNQDILYPIEVYQQTLESALKLIAANIQKLKEKA